MDDNLIICRCQEVTAEKIRQAIAEGAHTLDGIKRRSRAGMGLCQGKTCARLIARTLSEEIGLPLSEIQPLTARPPVRPLVLGAFEEDSDAESI